MVGWKARLRNSNCPRSAWIRSERLSFRAVGCTIPSISSRSPPVFLFLNLVCTRYVYTCVPKYNERLYIYL